MINLIRRIRAAVLPGISLDADRRPARISGAHDCLADELCASAGWRPVRRLGLQLLEPSLGWLSGTLRRWVNLMALVATLVGAVAFVATEHVAAAVIAIIALAVLVVSLTMELRETRRAFGASGNVRALLSRAISDGRAILDVHGPGVSTGMLWREWADQTASQLAERVGLVESHKFRSAHSVPEAGLGQPGSIIGLLRGQVAYLESLL